FVLELDLLVGALDRLAFGRLLAGSLGVGFLERDELGVRRLRRHHLYLSRRRARRLRPPRRRHARKLYHGCAFWADDRVFAQGVEFGAAMAAKALRSELGFGHCRGSLRFGAPKNAAHF